MYSIFANAFKVPELRSKLLYLLGMFVVYIVGARIPVPGIDREALEAMFATGSGARGIFNFLDLFSGGSLSNFSLFAIGITPYINASIILQLMTMAVPKLEQLAKEGESGRKIINQYTRYLTIVLAFIQAGGMYYFFSQSGVFPADRNAFYVALVVLTLVAGTAFLMRLGEEIGQKGIGNGVSLIIFIGIVASLPQQITQTMAQVRQDPRMAFWGFILVLITVAEIGFIILIQQGERKIPVHYAKRVVGKRVYGGQTSYIPLKVNQAGVIPIIFAISLLMFPSVLGQFVQNPTAQAAIQRFPQSGWYNFLYFILVVAFTFFYTAVVFQPKDVADRIKKAGGFIMGIRPGRPTVEYLEKIMVRVTFMGAMFLGGIAVLPNILQSLTNITAWQLGGTSVLILVGVAMDTVQNLEAQLMMRNYDGFLKY